jgi:hypothetical protein
MPVTVLERWDSRRISTGPDPRVELLFVVAGTEDEAEAQAALVAEAPGSYGGMPRIETGLERLAQDCWSATASYHFAGGSGNGYSFETTGGTAKVFCSIATSGAYGKDGPVPRARWRSVIDPSTGSELRPKFMWEYDGGDCPAFDPEADPAQANSASPPARRPEGQGLTVYTRCKAGVAKVPNCHGLIGVTKDGVEGVDIQVPTFKFKVTKRLPPTVVTLDYQWMLSRLSGTVNGAEWAGYAPGEVLFLGANGNQEGADMWQIAYDFAASPNADELFIRSHTGNIGPFPKLGWEYVWVRYEDYVDATSNAMTKNPVAAYVEQVYPYADFNLLGLEV